MFRASCHPRQPSRSVAGFRRRDGIHCFHGFDDEQGLALTYILSDIDNSVWTNAPGQSGQPQSPFYANTRESLGSGEYLPVLFSREAVEGGAAHTLRLRPGG